MRRCASVIKGNDNTRLVVISACSGVTNLLVELANGIHQETIRQERLTTLAVIHDEVLAKLPENTSVAQAVNALIDDIATLAEAAATSPSTQLTDSLVACGELLSTHLFTHLLNTQGISAVRFDAREALRTNSLFGKATPQLVETSSLVNEKLRPLCERQVVVTQGFIGADDKGNTTTLGRGGSDYSAALLAEALHADTLEIWTDVPGIYTTDPRVAPNAKPISEISFSEASEMANFGAKILHPSTLLPAMRQEIPVFVGSSKAPQQGGTWIRKTAQRSPLLRALALRSNQTMVTLNSLNMFHAYGFLAEVFNVLARHQISVDLISTSEVSVSLTLDQTDTGGGAPTLPDAALEELSALCTVKVEHGLSLVALIGNHMGETRGTASKIFGAMDQFNVRLICSGASDHNMCFLVNEEDSKPVIQALHERLFE
ncbi:lysine-sensitive aspartokinase 3 [Veronia pacifica]|uniref:Aspartokinase n=2 Tax=Veronia pacifica TaxID=1080227 RepID=A0A1C3ELR7_9GAMM|nr:lysine-sensitive aspartokinase 3 [Veronia pacifica]